MKTLSIAAVPHSYDGSSYYRLWLPFKHLAENSLHQTGVIPPGSELDGRKLDQYGGLDVAIFQRPAGTGGLQMLESLAGKVALVYELDDDMLQVDPSGLPHLHNEKTRESVRRCLRLCDMVTTSSEHLAETVRPYNPNVVVLPNHIKGGLLTLARPRRERLVVGWAGGTTHLIDMVTVQQPLKDVLDGCPDVDMHFMGCDFSPLLSRQCRWSNWEPDVGDYYKHVDFDIAIAPSADIPFNRSKTPIRALEMAALGIPVVAQNRAPYAEFVIDGKTGFLVDTDDEWRARLTDLVHDEGMRVEMGAAGREQASEWTIEEGWVKWEGAYEGLLGG
jgi:Glycosyl transferases group 1